MIIKTKYKTTKGRAVISFVSDKNVYIRQINTGRLYTKAIDTFPTRNRYEETDIPIPVREKNTDVEDVTIKE